MVSPGNRSAGPRCLLAPALRCAAVTLGGVRRIARRTPAGLAVGGVAGFAGGRLETALMAVADFVLVLPAIYVVLALRAAMPLVLSVPQVFWT